MLISDVPRAGIPWNSNMTAE